LVDRQIKHFVFGGEVSAAVFHGVFSLEFSLSEVLNYNAIAHFASEMLDKGTDNSLFIIKAIKTSAREQ
jgi:hypothetical protein